MKQKLLCEGKPQKLRGYWLAQERIQMSWQWGNMGGSDTLDLTDLVDFTWQKWVCVKETHVAFTG